MGESPKVFSFAWWAHFITDPRNRRLHALLIALALVAHLGLHYGTYIPSYRQFLGTLPYFKLHILHEAEFMLIVIYATLVFRLKGGVAALAITAVTSIPFLLTPYIFGREPRVDELRDLAIQVAFILLMGLVTVLLYESVARLREDRIALLDQVEQANVQLESKNRELEQLGHRLDSANRQLTGLNTLIQGQLNRLYDNLQRVVDEENRALESAPPQVPKERSIGFITRLSGIVRGQ